MVMPETSSQNDATTTKSECFLCALDSAQTCHEMLLEGRIIAAHERIVNGARTPVIILDTGTRRVELQLEDQYYRSFIKDLRALGDILRSYNLWLRVYHLPFSPDTVEYNGRVRSIYRGNAYTLAVLEPDTLLNITDLNQAEYCPRQYLLNRLFPSAPSTAAIRGNLVHYCFKELLKEHDRSQPAVSSEPASAGEQQAASAFDTLCRHLEQALSLYSIDMALAGIAADLMRAEVLPHLASLARWYESERETLWDTPAIAGEETGAGQRQDPADAQVRAETFLLAPEIGLRGRLDLFWQQGGRQRLLELKTGGASGELPRREHRWQVYGYHALLTVRRDSHMKKALATLLYSGTPERAQAFGIRSTIRELQRVNQTRNLLVLSRVTDVPPAPPGPARCARCALLCQCQAVSALLGWQPPEPSVPSAHSAHSPDWQESPGMAQGVSANSRPSTLVIDTAGEREFFATYYRLLQFEGRAGEQQQARLWKTTVQERIEGGTAISGLEPLGAAVVEKDGWQQSFRCQNSSELREGDEILLSSGNPISSEVVSGTIMAVHPEEVTVWTRELIARPALIDRYDNDLVHVRTLQNLLRWLQCEPHRRDLVSGKTRPRFVDRQVTPRPDFNAEQNLAIERALQMQDYLLIQGPPGTGKTGVIAEIVKRLCQQGQHVMLAGFTNQAVDNMLKRLEKEGFYDYVRLGHERSVDDAVRPHLLKSLVAARQAQDAQGLPALVRDILYSAPVIASTTATWSAGKYTSAGSLLQEEVIEETGLMFDVAIIDEAGQLTIPAILGALSFARRFILVGDEKQLPPLVLSKEAAEQGLALSLFARLKRLDDDYMRNHPLAVSACVSLRVQYRMNRWIANFASKVFYNNMLIAHESIANRRLPLKAAPSPAPPREAPHILQAIKPSLPLVFLNVQPTADELAHPEAKLSNAEARVVREIVAALLRRGIAPQDIGIIAPYRAQAAGIRRHLFSADPASGWQALPGDSPLSVDTVDRFQGGERMVIIMSFATSTKPAADSPRLEFLINPNRLNVALTRAQCKLILIGYMPALDQLPIFSRLAAYCRSMKTLIPVEDVRN
ncbi:MAG: AAA family ATPase [Ktedonobacteraceae bacterium]|nr:AAA family ATPase [Ktedonobacteraceae bacterium]